jgi:hypothetical protein
MAPIAIGIAPDDAVITGAVCSSPYEFQELQSGQRPSHFGDWLPHSVHEKTAAAFFAKCARL